MTELAPWTQQLENAKLETLRQWASGIGEPEPDDPTVELGRE